MAGLDKHAAAYQEALGGLTNNMTLLTGDFGLYGTPENLITEVRHREVQGPTVVSSNCGMGGFDFGVLLGIRQVRRAIASYVGENALFEKQVLSGELEAILTLQGTLVEQLHAGNVGIPALSTTTGYGTPAAEGKEVREFVGHPYTFEQAIAGDFILVRDWKADWYDNVIYRHTAQNFNPLMTAVGCITVVEVEGIVPPGELDPTAIHTPGIPVNRIIQGQFGKHTEQRTLRQKGA